MTKLAWIALPLALYALYAAVASWRGRAPTKAVLNAHTSLLLMVYLLTTAGLGVFWVANQQLPVFDWHYLFGYATVALVALHLALNLPLAWRVLRKGDGKRRKVIASRGLALWLAALVAVAGAFVLGMRHGHSELRLAPSAGVDSRVDLVARYHDHGSLSRSGVFARAPSIDWGDEPSPFKRYQGLPVLSLPAPERPSRPLSVALVEPADHGVFDAGALSTVLFHTAGVTARRGGFALRAAPSSGGLFPTEIYVIAREIAGVPPGLHHYDASQHALTALGPAPDVPGDSPAVVVLTSVFRRTGYKYRDRAYRYALADAGHLLENLRIASHEAGLWIAPAATFDEAAAAALLGIDGVEEGVLAWVPLSRRPPDPLPPMVAAPILDDPSLGITGAVHLATSLRRDDASASDALPLPASEPAGAEALATIAARRSQRRFGDAAISAVALASILADASQSPLLSTAVRVHLVVNRVDGIAPGVYRHDPAGLVPTGLSPSVGDLAARAGAAALSQDVVADAAVVFVLTALRDRMFATHGARGYRHAFLEAGAVGERLLLSAAARDLGACPVGAFYDDESAALLGIDLAEEWVLHFAAIGVLESSR